VSLFHLAIGSAFCQCTPLPFGILGFNWRFGRTAAFNSGSPAIFRIASGLEIEENWLGYINFAFVLVPSGSCPIMPLSHVGENDWPPGWWVVEASPLSFIPLICAYRPKAQDGCLTKTDRRGQKKYWYS